MMLDALRRFDPKTAAGILAQAAMHLEGPNLGPEDHLVENQHEIELTILAELRAALGIPPDDRSERAIETLADALDQQSDKFSEAQKQDATDRLSAEGLLSSDVYQLTFADHLPNNLQWRWSIEERLASETVKMPDKEQILGTGVSVDGSAPLVTIFGRYFRHKFPARSFWLLVLGERSGHALIVSQIWRAYPNTVDLSNCETLLDVVRAVAEKFGQAMEIEGHLAKFFFRAKFDNLQTAQNITRISTKPGDRFTVTYFSGTRGDQNYVFLIVPMNLTLYFNSVENWRGWDRDLLDSLNLRRRSPHQQTN